ncbi:MAG: phosphotriesterase-related protein [Chloroflexi bacterium]|nr:phosphotriesterase-related protein [Chloroflexota bacterium]
MARVNTVLGPLDGRRLGFTLGHEHVVASSAGIRQTYPEFMDRRQAVREAVQQLRVAYQEGVRAIVDVTTIDLGRDVRLLREVSRRSGVHIVAATGTWLDIPRAFWSASPDAVAAIYAREIEVGIEGTGIKAGVIKVATDAGGVTPQGEIILRAAARACNRAGAPITTHTRALERVGEQQVRVFEEEGVDPGRVCIGHSNNTTDMDYLLGLLRRGVWLGLDQFPGGMMPGTPNWEERAEQIVKLVKAGFGHRLLLSHDHSVANALASREMLAQRRQNNPDGYLFITRRVLPRLKELGLPEKAVRQITVENPRNFLEGR